jgi:hypothetical protein
MNTATTTTLLDLDEFLSNDLSEVATPPEFVSLPNGTYRLRVEKCEIKKGETKEHKPYQRINHTYSVVDTLKLANQDEPPVPNESLARDSYNVGTREQAGFWKLAVIKIMNVSAEDLDGVPAAQLMEGLVGIEFTAKVTNTVSTDKVSKREYENVRYTISAETSDESEDESEDVPA